MPKSAMAAGAGRPASAISVTPSEKFATLLIPEARKVTTSAKRASGQVHGHSRMSRTHSGAAELIMRGASRVSLSPS